MWLRERWHALDRDAVGWAGSFSFTEVGGEGRTKDRQSGGAVSDTGGSRRGGQEAAAEGVVGRGWWCICVYCVPSAEQENGVVWLRVTTNNWKDVVNQ